MICGVADQLQSMIGSDAGQLQSVICIKPVNNHGKNGRLDNNDNSNPMTMEDDDD